MRGLTWFGVDFHHVKYQPERTPGHYCSWRDLFDIVCISRESMVKITELCDKGWCVLICRTSNAEMDIAVVWEKVT